MAITFTIDDIDEKDMRKWIEEHNKTCPWADPNKYRGAIGGRFSYSFTNTSIGQIQTIECCCGEKYCFSNL
jgi:hypothetical protein